MKLIVLLSLLFDFFCTPVLGQEPLPDSIVTIPVVVHVIYNQPEQNISDVQIHSQFQVLNNDFRRMNADSNQTPAFFRPVAADTYIQFRLAVQDPNGNPTNGITRRYSNKEGSFNYSNVKFNTEGGKDIWDRDKYLNIWVCDLGERILGTSQYPGAGSAKTDGIVINYRYFGTVGTVASPFNKGRTTTHEVGHWLNLNHIWGDNNCGDDLVADTPPQEKATTNCNSFPASSCSNYSDMFMNYMDYSSDACKNMFTKGQSERMRTTLTTFRQSLLSSEGLVPLELAASDPDAIKLYPNPSNGIVYLECYLPLASVQLKVYDTKGTAIKVQNVNELTPTIKRLDMPNLANGLYILHLSTDKGTFIRKLLIFR